MSAVRVIDTSVFCNLLAVPGRCQRKDETLDDLEDYIGRGDTLLLPMATVYETGNHIAKADRGRRSAALRFVDKVGDALDGNAPFEPTEFHDASDIRAWLEEFPDDAVQGMGIADRSIKAVWEVMCGKLPARRVLIWAYDDDLRGHECPPEI